MSEPGGTRGGLADRGFRRRLGYLLLGLAIGLVMVGLLRMARRAAVGPGVAPAGVEPGGAGPEGRGRASP